MFTGLIADLGSVRGIERDSEGATLEISTRLAGELGEGDSVAVNGVCLTATAVDGEGFRAQAMEETLRRSSLGDLAVGSPVNLELALRADGRLGGHIVQGHVDATATIAAMREEGFARVLDVEADEHARALSGGEGIGGDRRGEPHRERGSRRRLLRVADPRDASAHDPRGGEGGGSGQHRGGRACKAR